MKRHFLFSSTELMMGLTIMLVLPVSCNKENEPDDEIPLTLVSCMDDPVTRATVSNTWNGGEQVQVSINNGAALSFTAKQNGDLLPVNPINWPSAPSSISARAWHPVSWIFPVDQSKGLQPADFIFAPTVTGIMASNYKEKKLVFYHRTAKVTVKLMAGTDIKSVSGATVALYGYVAGIPNTTDAGNGVIAGSGGDWITPQNTGSDTYTALMIPRNMTGTKFVRITLGGNVYYYTPTADQAVLQQGVAYAYNITVSLTRIDVVVESGIKWTEGSEYDITPV